MREITANLNTCHIHVPVYEYCVLSIDIGILHLGISVTLLDKEYNKLEIIWIDLIDITEFTHKYAPSRKECSLHRTKTFCVYQ